VNFSESKTNSKYKPSWNGHIRKAADLNFLRVHDSRPVFLNTEGGSQMPYFISLLPRHKLNLFCVNGDGHRFANLFRKTWECIPVGCRRLLLKDWKSTSRGPLFELISEKSDFKRGNSGDAIANYCPGFRSFAFSSNDMDALSDKSVIFVIAHELAHAVLGIKDPSMVTGKHKAEVAADRLANNWTDNYFTFCSEIEEIYIK
jgi:hypothetical protein